MIKIFKKPFNPFIIIKIIIVIPLIAVGAYIIISNNEMNAVFMNSYTIYFFTAYVALCLVNGIEETKKPYSRKWKVYLWFGIAVLAIVLGVTFILKIVSRIG